MLTLFHCTLLAADNDMLSPVNNSNDCDWDHYKRNDGALSS